MSFKHLFVQVLCSLVAHCLNHEIAKKRQCVTLLTVHPAISAVNRDHTYLHLAILCIFLLFILFLVAVVEAEQWLMQGP